MAGPQHECMNCSNYLTTIFFLKFCLWQYIRCYLFIESGASNNLLHVGTTWFLPFSFKGK